MEVQDSFYSLVENVCRDLYIQSLKQIPPDVVAAIRRAAANETKEVAKRIFPTTPIHRAGPDQRHDCLSGHRNSDLLGGYRREPQAGWRAADRGDHAWHRTGHARTSFALEHCLPAQTRESPTSTGQRIPIIHYDFVANSEQLDILFMPKGSGSENMSFLKMLVPADGINGIKKFVLEQVVGAGAKPCPPTIVGIGYRWLVRSCNDPREKATSRPLGSKNPDSQMAALEEELFDAINQTGIGPQGLGGNTTALAVPYRVCLDSHYLQSRRREHAMLAGGAPQGKVSADGKVEMGF